jgi:hypothetical protein
MPRQLRDDAHGKRVLGIGSPYAGLHEDFFPRQELDRPRVEGVEMLRQDGLIHRPPIHVRLGEFVPDDELVLRRAPRELARPHHQRAVVREQPFLALDGVLDESFRAEIAKRSAYFANAECLQFVARSRVPFMPGVVGSHLLLS